MDNEDNTKRVVHLQIILEQVKKGTQVYNNYSSASLSNQDLILQYRFGLMINKNDTVTIGLGLADAVGQLRKTPSIDYNKDEVVALVTANNTNKNTTKPKKKKITTAGDKDENKDTNTSNNPNLAPAVDAPYMVFNLVDVLAVNVWCD